MCRLRADGYETIGVDIAAHSTADEHLVVDCAAADVVGLAAYVGDRHLAGLVNCAGDAFHGSIVDTSREVWDRTLAINLRSVFLITRALFSSLSSTSGSIINVASVDAEATSEGLAA